MRIVRNLLPWGAAAYIAFIFVWYLQYKFTGHEGSVQLFTILTDWLGFHGHEKAMRIGVGTMELIASILLFIRPLQVPGAGLSFGIISGAIFFHLVSPLGVDPYDDGAKLFVEACAVWLFSLTILVLREEETVRWLSMVPVVGNWFAADPRAAR